MSRHPALWPLLSVLAVLAPGAPAAAQQWKVFEEEMVSLEYRDAADAASLLSVSCGARRSDLTVPLAPGIRPPAQPPELRVTEQAGTQAMKMQTEVCGGELTCTDRPNGDAASYFIQAADKQVALRLADRATSLSIDAPGIRLSVTADKTAFARFAALCRKQK